MQAQFEGIPVPCYVWHRRDGVFILERANRAAFDMTGPRLNDILGRTVREVFAHQLEIAGDLEQVHSTGQAVQRELDYVSGQDGATRRFNVTFVPIGPDRVLAHTEDVTVLRVSEERLRAVLATVEAGLLAIDLGGRVADV